MAYTWTPDLETGNPLIDSQHKQLIQALNDLLNACMSGKGKETLHSTLDFLASYTVKHFGDEEKLQIQHQYPDYQNHKKLHLAFVSFVNDLAAKLKTQGPTTLLVGQVTTGVGDWLVNHIKREDLRVANHIRQIGDKK
jgi:hemerythrin